MKLKFVSKTQPDQIDALWRPLLRGREEIDSWSLSFNADDRDYDALVVYEGLPPNTGERKILRSEDLSCARANTLLLTTEPSSIRIDGTHFLRQFGHVWTAKHPSLVKHSNQIQSTPPLRYFYGRNMTGGEHAEIPTDMPPKSRTLSGMSSTKAMNHTLHQARLSFMKRIKERLGDNLDLFGRGILPVDDKADAMRDYHYHIAVENHQQSGHFTEKLTDCFVAGCLPFYFGDPDYASVFPKDAVIPIDIFDLDEAERIIRNAIDHGEYERRREAINEARDIALTQFNTLDAVACKMTTLFDQSAERGGIIHGRHAFRRAHPILAVHDAVFSARARRSPHAQARQM